MPSTPWRPDSWRERTARQQPAYPAPEASSAVEARLNHYPPLVLAPEVDTLCRRLADVAEGRAFLLHGGDCAESFADFAEPKIRDTFKVLLQMAVVLTFGGAMPVVKVARLAGQYAKPRSQATEEREGRSLPAYRGDIVNAPEFSEAARRPDPERMIAAYHHAAATLNLLRGYAQGGLADLHQVAQWNMSFVESNPLRERYQQMADRISETLHFMDVMGVNSASTSTVRETQLYTSHEALLLPYEEALARRATPHCGEGAAGPSRAGTPGRDGPAGDWYASSAHFLWIGERTRSVEEAHVEFCRGVANPIGVKIGPAIEPDELMRLIDRLNPHNTPGRLTLIARMGADRIQQRLPPLLRRVRSEGRSVVWVSDPMHENTVTTAAGLKTRDFDAIMREIAQFFAAHGAEGTYPGGVHLEMTGEQVTECTGGAYGLSVDDLAACYRSHCDPRLNADQVLELAFLLADTLKGLAGS